MTAGNYARAFMNQENLETIIAVIEDDTRRDVVRRLLASWMRMRPVWRTSKDPRTEHAELFGTFLANRKIFLTILEQELPWVKVPVYVHYAVDHVPIWLDIDGQSGDSVVSIGALSSEALEGANKWWRYVREHLARSDRRGLEDALVFMWLRAHPVFADLIFVEPEEQFCSSCRQSGHNIRTCPVRKKRLAEEAKDAEDDPMEEEDDS